MTSSSPRVTGIAVGKSSTTAGSAAKRVDRRRQRRSSSTLGAADWLLSTDVDVRWRISTRYPGRRSLSEWPNRCQFFCWDALGRIVRTLLRHASPENSICSGLPAASRKRISGPPAIPSLARSGAPTDILGSLPVILR